MVWDAVLETNAHTTLISLPKVTPNLSLSFSWLGQELTFIFLSQTSFKQLHLLVVKFSFSTWTNPWLMVKTSWLAHCSGKVLMDTIPTTTQTIQQTLKLHYHLMERPQSSSLAQISPHIVPLCFLSIILSSKTVFHQVSCHMSLLETQT
jgi:hypothetical protein